MKSLTDEQWSELVRIRHNALKHRRHHVARDRRHTRAQEHAALVALEQGEGLTLPADLQKRIDAAEARRPLTYHEHMRLIGHLIDDNETDEDRARRRRLQESDVALIEAARKP